MEYLFPKRQYGIQKRWRPRQWFWLIENVNKPICNEYNKIFNQDLWLSSICVSSINTFPGQVSEKPFEDLLSSVLILAYFLGKIQQSKTINATAPNVAVKNIISA